MDLRSALSLAASQRARRFVPACVALPLDQYPQVNPDPPEHYGPMQTSRRQFIASATAGAIVLTLDRTLSFAADSMKMKTIPIGFQLYTVRGEFSRNVPGTLKTLGQIGYKGVEFWGYAGTLNVYHRYTAA